MRPKSVSEENKAMVRRLVEAINADEEEAAVEELFVPRAARRVKRLFVEFRSAFPDWCEEAVQLVAEGDTVAGRFRCSGTHLGEFLGNPPTGRRMEVEEVFFVRAEDGGSWTSGDLRTPWEGCGSWVCCHRDLELRRSHIPRTRVNRVF
jgi:predicted ester cyclase